MEKGLCYMAWKQKFPTKDIFLQFVTLTCAVGFNVGGSWR